MLDVKGKSFGVSTGSMSRDIPVHHQTCRRVSRQHILLEDGVLNSSQLAEAPHNFTRVSLKYIC